MTDERAGESRDDELNRAPSDAVRDAIADDPGVDEAHVDDRLFEDIDPDALDDLFRADPRPQTSVELHTNAVQVKLWGDGSVEVQALGREEDA